MILLWDHFEYQAIHLQARMSAHQRGHLYPHIFVRADSKVVHNFGIEQQNRNTLILYKHWFWIVTQLELLYFATTSCYNVVIMI